VILMVSDGTVSIPSEFPITNCEEEFQQ